VQFAVMDPADWRREFIADPAGERAWLREPNVMRLGRRAAAHDAWLRGDEFAVLLKLS
jgi:SH3-like domain-containing protein